MFQDDDNFRARLAPLYLKSLDRRKLLKKENIIKARSILSFLIIVGLPLNCAGVYAQLGGVTQLGDKTLKFDKQKFIAKVHANQLGAMIPFDGCAAVIINKDGNIVADTARGSAVRADKSVNSSPMTTSTPNDIGSDFKLISFIHSALPV